MLVPLPKYGITCQIQKCLSENFNFKSDVVCCPVPALLHLHLFTTFTIIQLLSLPSSSFTHCITITAVPCTNLTAPANGYVDKVGPHVYLSSANFSCATGYEFCENCSEVMTTFCQANQTWSLGHTPNCSSKFTL